MTHPHVFRSARVWSNRELRKIAPLFRGDIVNVSAGEDKDKEGNSYADYFPNRDSWAITNYSPGSFRGFQGREDEYLLDLTEPLPAALKGKFDVAISHTTLEHVFDVRTAMRNLCSLSRDIVIVIVPFCQVQHEMPNGYQDFWRFTPTCLRSLFLENGMTSVYEAESPDRDASIYLMAVGSKHPDRWTDRFPQHRRIEQAGQWIGRRPATPLSRVLKKLKRR